MIAPTGRGVFRWKAGVGAVGLAAAVSALPAGEPPALTSLSNSSLEFTVPDKPYAVLKRGDLELVVVDNRAVDDAVLPGHRPGYSGVASLKHARQPRNLFVPAYAGLNFEHILDGTMQERAVLFEPRNVPMQLRVFSPHVVELYQAPTPHYAVESCHRFELRADGVIEMTFECIPRRVTWAKGYLLFFWASYIDRPESLDIHFLGRTEGETGEARWIRGVTPRHGAQATHRSLDDNRVFAHVEPFPLELPFGFSRHRYAEPWYFGVCRDMAFAQSFRPRDEVRLTQSPSGGGNGCPAWDFQWAIPNCQVGRRYQLVMRVLYTPLSGGADDLSAREKIRGQLRGLRGGTDAE
jgi:hypothetical protein